MEHNKNPFFWPLVYLSTAAFAALIIWMIVKLPPTRHTERNPFSREYSPAKNEENQTTDAETESAASEPNLKTAAESNTPPPPVVRPKITIEDVLRTARTWAPAYTSWYGKPAPDFALPDINGKQHKLSDYKGKTVMLVFWATWCRPCLREIPHLIELRNTISEDQLAILAISNESPALVKRFSTDAKINYTVLTSSTRILPSPYSSIVSIPSSFFIKPDGSVKLATEGYLQPETTKAIIQAE